MAKYAVETYAQIIGAAAPNPESRFRATPSSGVLEQAYRGVLAEYASVDRLNWARNCCETEVKMFRSGLPSIASTMHLPRSWPDPMVTDPGLYFLE